MQEVVLYLMYAIPFVIVAMASVATVITIGIALERLWVAALIFIGILVFFTGSSYGQLEAERTIYSRGVGVFYISFVNICLLVIAVLTWFSKTYSKSKASNAGLFKYYWVYFVLMFANVIVAANSEWSEKIFFILSPRGLFNFISLAALSYVLVNVFDNEELIKKAGSIVLILIGLRGVFGIVRWAFFGGDSANVYNNFEGTGSKITFFDINDGFLAAFAIFVSAWLLIFRPVIISLRAKYLLIFLMLLEIAIILLSLRRSAIIGFSLTAIMFVMILPARHRLPAFLAGSLVAGAGVTIMGAMRLSKLKGAADSHGFFFDLWNENQSTESSSRVLEYVEAWNSLGNNWLYGNGMWGLMHSNSAALSYHGGDFSFVHNALGHILLKGGLVSVACFVFMMIYFGVHYFINRKKLTGLNRMMADAGFAGVMFYFPTFMIGTPIIEFRTMMLFGLALTLPTVAQHITNTSKDQNAVT